MAGVRLGTSALRLGVSALALTAATAAMPPDFDPSAKYDQETADLVAAIPHENVKTLTVSEASAGTGAHFSGGTVPTTSNDIEIDEGETLHVYDGQTISARYIWVTGTIVLHGGASLIADTVFVMPETGVLYTTNVSKAKRITWTVLTESDIDVADDQQLISRGLVSGGSIRIEGPARQRLLPIANDVIADTTTALTFKTPPFVGFDGAGGETAFALDWDSDDDYILAATEVMGATFPSGHLGLTNELIKLSAFTPNVTATTFSPYDPEGSTGTLATTPVWDHKEYWDATALAKAREFGPPIGSPTHGSHSNWAGRPWIYNMSKYIVFKKSDPDCPIQRNPYVLLYSRHSHIAHCEFQGGSTGWGRTSVSFENYVVIPGSDKLLFGSGVPTEATGYEGNLYINKSADTYYTSKNAGAWPTVNSLFGYQRPFGDITPTTVNYGTGAPDNGLGSDGEFYVDEASTNFYGPKASGTWPSATSFIGLMGQLVAPHTASTNLRCRNAIQVWHAGWRLPSQRSGEDEVPRVSLNYNSLWGGTVGDAKTNGEELAGGPCAFIQSWASEVFMEGNVSYNTGGPCTWDGTPWETGETIGNSAMSVWGDTPDGVSTGIKTLPYYTLHDLGRSGDGHLSYARQKGSKRQIAHGCNGTGVMFFTRTYDKMDRFHAAYNMVGPEQMRWTQYSTQNLSEQPHLDLEGAYVTACNYAIWVNKAGPEQTHGIRSIISNSLGFNNKHGAFFEYTYGYNWRQIAFCGPDDASVAANILNQGNDNAVRAGFAAGPTIFSMNFDSNVIANYPWGIRLNRVFAAPYIDDGLPDPTRADTAHHAINTWFRNVGDHYYELDETEIFEDFTPTLDPAEFGAQIDAITEMSAASGNSRLITGTFRDPLGDYDVEFPWDIEVREINSNNNLPGLCSTYGYWTDTSGFCTYLTLYPFWHSSRYGTGRRLVMMPVPLSGLPGQPGFVWNDPETGDAISTFTNNGTAHYNDLRTAFDAAMDPDGLFEE